MSRIVMTIVFAALTTGVTRAQIELRQDDGGTDFTSRGSLAATTDGFAVQRNDIWGIQEIDRWSSVMQDQDCATSSIWETTLFGESSAVPGTADDTNVIATTGPFVSPGGAAGACAWFYTVTLTTSLAPGTTCSGSGVFTGVALPSEPTWPMDGTSTHASVAYSGSTAEIPNGLVRQSYPPTTVGQGPGAVYASEFATATGAGANTTYAPSWQIYGRNTLWMGGANGVAYDIRCGAVESFQSSGLYSSLSAVGPTNYGMAGKYPDFINQSASPRSREDHLTYHTVNHDIVNGLEQVFLAESTLRCAAVSPVDLPGVGRFELDPTSTLFDASTRLHPPVVVRSAEADHFLSLGLLLPGNLRSAFIPVAPGSNLTVHYQAVRVDLVTGAVKVSSMRSWSHQW